MRLGQGPARAWHIARASRIIISVALAALFLWGAWTIWDWNTFRISGVVVDEQGQPLSDVLVSFTTSRRIKGGFDSDTKSRIFRTNGSFDIKVSWVHHVSLGFVVTGYEYQQVDFARPNSYHYLRITLKRK